MRAKREKSGRSVRIGRVRKRTRWGRTRNHLPLPRDSSKLLQSMPLLSPLQNPSVLLRVDVERFLVLFLDGDHPQLGRSSRVPTRFVLRDPSATILLLLVFFVVVLGGRIEGRGGFVGVVVVGRRRRGERVVEAVGRGLGLVLEVRGGVAMEGGSRKGRSGSSFPFVRGGREGRPGELVMGCRVTGRRS